MLDAAVLSRMQFAFTVSFHIIFPTLSIGLACWLAVMEGLWLKTGKLRYYRFVRYWQKPFALTFGMGVVSGIVLSFQFGTNFSKFSEIVGPVLGPLLAYEVMTAFFLEAGFLGVMLFGWQKVSPRVHFIATATVAFGTLLSAFWILAANSWMQTPAGYAWQGGQLVPTDWWAVIFNPSFPYRLLHMLLASFISASLFVLGVSAWQWRSRHNRPMARLAIHSAITVLVLLVPLQVLVGDMHGLNVKAHQPVKLAAMEGVWQTEQGAAFRVVAVPDQQNAKNSFEIAIPNALSLLLTHDLNGEIKGLNEVPANERPHVATVFYSFRVMLALGFAMLALVVWGGYLRFRKQLFNSHYFLLACQWATLSGVLATLAGWYVVETGRQPWLVQGLVKTMEVVTPLPAARVAWSLLLFVTVYGLLFTVYSYFMLKILRAPKVVQPSVHSAAMGGY